MVLLLVEIPGVLALAALEVVEAVEGVMVAKELRKMKINYYFLFFKGISFKRWSLMFHVKIIVIVCRWWQRKRVNGGRLELPRY